MTPIVVWQSLTAGQGMGRWVMGQMGHENRVGHMGHGSVGVDPWPIIFFNFMAGIINL